MFLLRSNAYKSSASEEQVDGMKGRANEKEMKCDQSVADCKPMMENMIIYIIISIFIRKCLNDEKKILNSSLMLRAVVATCCQIVDFRFLHFT